MARRPTLSRESRSPLWTARYAQSSSSRNDSADRVSPYVWSSLRASLRRSLVPSDWASRPAFTRWKSGVGTQQVRGEVRRDRLADEFVRLGPERQPVLLLHRAGLALGVVQGPLVERDDALPRLFGQLLAELDRLRQDDLFLGGEQRDLADLLEVHPDRVVDPDHVRGDGFEVLGRGLLDGLGIQLGRGVGRQCRSRIGRAVVRDHDDPDVRPVGRGRVRPQVEIVVVIVVIVVAGDGRAGLGARRTQAGRLGLFEFGLGAAWPGQDGFDELLVEGIGGHGLTSWD